VRDVLQVADLFDLISRQIDVFDRYAGQTDNVCGGTAVSISLAELTALCAARTGTTLALARTCRPGRRRFPTTSAMLIGCSRQPVGRRPAR
jgi:hypothetical protein